MNVEEQETEEKAERIAAEAKDVRERTRDLVVDVLRSGKDSIGRLPSAAGRVLEGAWRGVENVAEERRADVFRDVIDGLSDGLSRGAHAVKLTVEEAKSRGQSYAKDEIKGTVQDLRTLESIFVERIETLVKSSASTTSEQARDLVSHARRAASGMRPEIKSAIEAAERHPFGLAKETASVAAGASRRAAGSLLQGIAGVLEGLGDLIGGDRKSGQEPANSEQPESEEKQA